MTKIQLTRIVKPGVVITNGVASIENRAKTVCVTLEGPDGSVISLAFDGRYDCDSAGGGALRETYEPYRDCPVMTFRGENGPATDVQALRALRDALMAMDLDAEPVEPVEPVVTIKPVVTNASGMRFRSREYNCSGSTSYRYSNDYNELTNRIDEGVEAGCLTGGGIDEWANRIGWVVFED